MNKENIEEILNKYKLSEEEHDYYYQIIKRFYLQDKLPVENPVAVIIGGQTGAGKSGIIGYSTEMFEDNNVIIINSDEIKPFHPHGEEIARNYPKLYTKITDQESNTWTSKLFEELRREKYNIIFEGTMKNNRIADESIPELQQLGYTVVVRGLAVCDLESRMSVLERYEGQVNHKGWGRLVVTEHHNQTYEGMPRTIDYIEENDRYDILEIYSRGSKPDQPTLIYSKHNPLTVDKTQRSIADKDNISRRSQRFGYSDGLDSIIRGREEDYERVVPDLARRLQIVLDSMNERGASKEEKQMVLDLMQEYGEIIKKKRMEIVNKDGNGLDLEGAKKSVEENYAGDANGGRD